MANAHVENVKIGDSIRVKRGFMTVISLVYAGMPSENVFSLVVTTTAGHMGMGYNLYFPASQRQLEIAGVSVSVQSVSPTSVQLTLERR
ncbi:MAG: hypothetical protein JW741_13245 [Sedimentisphaerales bacterium]|nr:hypothetical protein [Sedimentisphaerales bacterium]